MFGELGCELCLFGVHFSESPLIIIAKTLTLYVGDRPRQRECMRRGVIFNSAFLSFCVNSESGFMSLARDAEARDSEATQLSECSVWAFLISRKRVSWVSLVEF